MTDAIDRRDREARPGTKLLFGAGLAAVAIGRAVESYRNRKQDPEEDPDVIEVEGEWTG